MSQENKASSPGRGRDGTKDLSTGFCSETERPGEKAYENQNERGPRDQRFHL